MSDRGDPIMLATGVHTKEVRAEIRRMMTFDEWQEVLATTPERHKRMAERARRLIDSDLAEIERRSVDAEFVPMRGE